MLADARNIFIVKGAGGGNDEEAGSVAVDEEGLSDVDSLNIELSEAESVACTLGIQWGSSKRWADFGYDELPCPNWEAASCCVCKAILENFENAMNKSASRLHEPEQTVESGWRIDGRSRVPFVRSAGFITENLEKACHHLSVNIPLRDSRPEEAKDILADDCGEFLDLLEDSMLKAYFNNFTSQVSYICGDDVVGACGDYVCEEIVEYEDIEEDG